MASSSLAQLQRASAELRMRVSPTLGRRAMAMAVRYSLYLLEKRAPGPGVEVRVAPYAAVKVLDGPASDPHNLTPPDVIELEPVVWLRMACGVTTWQEEKDEGHIAAVGPRDDLRRFLPLV
ncbi:sterol carrier family protein [Pseudoscardovia suis]